MGRDVQLVPPVGQMPVLLMPQGPVIVPEGRDRVVVDEVVDEVVLPQDALGTSRSATEAASSRGLSRLLRVRQL